MRASAPWRDWLRLRRLIPLLVIFAALAVLLLDATGKLEHVDYPRVMVLLIGLLAFDALIERIALLEKIHQLVRQRTANLSNRSTLHADIIFAGATDVALLGITLLNLLSERRDVFRDLLERGGHLRVLLLDPKSNAWKALLDSSPTENHKAHRQASLQVLNELRMINPAKCEVRYTSSILPACLVIVDAARSNAHLIAEFPFPGTAPHDRPHLELSRTEDPEWFHFLCDRFDKLWGDQGSRSVDDFFDRTRSAPVGRASAKQH